MVYSGGTYSRVRYWGFRTKWLVTKNWHFFRCQCWDLASWVVGEEEENIALGHFLLMMMMMMIMMMVLLLFIIMRMIRSFSPAADRRIVPLPSSQVVCWQQDDSDYECDHHYHYYDVDDNFDQTCGFYDTAEGRSRPASPTTHLDQVNAVVIIAIVAIAVTQVMAWFTAKLISCPILQVGGKCPRGNLFQ